MSDLLLSSEYEKWLASREPDVSEDEAAADEETAADETD
jgi:hypothetical protein